MKNKKNVLAFGSGHTCERLIGLLRESAQDLLAHILAAESERFLRRFADMRDDLGREAVVRNGFQPQRHIETGIGPVSVRFPKLRSRIGKATVFRSSVVPRYVRRMRAVDRESVWRYLYGTYSCDLNQVLVALLGSQATHVATLVPECVRNAWAADCMHKRSGRLAEPRLLELWAECIESDPAWVGANGSVLAVLGSDEIGALRLLAIDHGLVNSPSRWMRIVRSLASRGLQWPERMTFGAAASGSVDALEAVQVGSLERKREPADASIELWLPFAQRPMSA